MIEAQRRKDVDQLSIKYLKLLFGGDLDFLN